jgi:hypothetical protein
VPYLAEDPPSAADIEAALVTASKLLDQVLEHSRTRESSTNSLAQYYANTAELEDAVRAALLEAREELLCVAPEPSHRDSDWLGRAGSWMPSLLDRGVRVGVLCGPGAWSAWRGGDLLGDPAAAGLEVRVAERNLHEMVVLDGRVAFLRVPVSGTATECLEVSAPAVLRGLGMLFRATWNSAEEPAAYDQRMSYLDETAVRILGHLAAGVKDESAARDLGCSVRTYRRHVARIMCDLNASTRFQAGVRAAGLRLIGAGPSSDPVGRKIGARLVPASP